MYFASDDDLTVETGKAASFGILWQKNLLTEGRLYFPPPSYYFIFKRVDKIPFLQWESDK